MAATHRRLNQYHFSFGNSTKGPIGYCARIDGFTREHAARRLQKLLPEISSLVDDPLNTGEYIEAYLNPDYPKGSNGEGEPADLICVLHPTDGNECRNCFHDVSDIPFPLET